MSGGDPNVSADGSQSQSGPDASRLDCLDATFLKQAREALHPPPAILSGARRRGCSRSRSRQSRDAARAGAGSGAIPVTLLVNGKPQKVMIEPRDTLATVLPDKLGQTGTRWAAIAGGLGACGGLGGRRPDAVLSNAGDRCRGHSRP